MLDLTTFPPLADEHGVALPEAIQAEYRTSLHRAYAVGSCLGGWTLGKSHSIGHVDDCECEGGDPFTIEEVDERCSVDTHATTVVTLCDGQYVLAAVDLDAYSKLVHEVLALGADDLPLVVIDGDGNPRLVDEQYRLIVEACLAGVEL